MASGFDTVSFLSDYGLVDEFVGVVKAVIRAFAPEATVLDVTHQVAPHDVRGGSLVLARSIQYLPAGVVLAVVDPGVGTDRRAVAVEVGDDDPDGPGRSVLVGPDNGLLAPAVALAGGARRAVALTNPAYHLPTPGPTFAGRDVFGPVAAHLCTGVELDELGEAVDPYSLVPGIVPLSRAEDGAIEAEVLWVDRFGNAQLNLDPDDLAAMGSPVVLRMGDRSRSAVRVGTYAELGPGQVGLVVDSYGLLAISLDRRSAAEELHLAPGDLVRLEPAQ
ncbi:MAG TPA: SAM-dependent chlorinase/fluorinase [Acidimicrobiales bacterium]|nr:SAM-dependent chlorinase/fluorinase [Acidimicrobiales bacterium]